MNVLPFEQQVRIVASLVEGNSIRATERMTGADRNTIMSLGVRVGEACKNLHGMMVRNLNVSLVEVDEVWSFVFKKEKKVTTDDPASFGDQYVFIGMDATRKAIISYVVGKRTSGNADRLANDLRSRILNRPQITSDAFPAYPNAIEGAFGSSVDHAVVQKAFDTPAGMQEASRRYSPGKIRAVSKIAVNGDPDLDVAGTSYIERQNLTARMQMRRFTRLTNGFSKKGRNHRAAVDLYVSWYNLCRVHESLRTTPAMAIGITDHVWTIGELITRALELPRAPSAPPAPVDPHPAPLSRAAVGGAVYPYRAGRPMLRLIQGGRA